MANEQPPEPGSREALGQAPIEPKSSANTSIVGKFAWPKQDPGESNTDYDARVARERDAFNKKKSQPGTSAIQREALK